MLDIDANPKNFSLLLLSGCISCLRAGTGENNTILDTILESYRIASMAWRSLVSGNWEVDSGENCWYSIMPLEIGLIASSGRTEEEEPCFLRIWIFCGSVGFGWPDFLWAESPDPWKWIHCFHSINFWDFVVRCLLDGLERPSAFHALSILNLFLEDLKVFSWGVNLGFCPRYGLTLQVAMMKYPDGLSSLQPIYYNLSQRSFTDFSC